MCSCAELNYADKAAETVCLEGTLTESASNKLLRAVEMGFEGYPSEDEKNAIINYAQRVLDDMAVLQAVMDGQILPTKLREIGWLNGEYVYGFKFEPTEAVICGECVENYSDELKRM